MQTKTFPDRREGRYFLTEGGVETEIMYKWGFELPHFAMFPLLERKDASDAIRGMYRRYLDVVARRGHSALMGGFDYRASPDWGAKLGYSAAGLEAANLQAIDFLKVLAGEYVRDIPEALIVGYLGPRGDAYLDGEPMTSDEARDYHAVQLATLKKADVDLVQAVTFNNIEEAVGAVEAACGVGLPVSVSFSLDSSHRLNTGPSLKEAIEIVDTRTGGYAAYFALNCSHPLEFNPALEPGDWTGRLRCIRPNAAAMDKISLCKLGHLEEGDPRELGEQMSEIARRFPQMDIWGGCCGTGHEHLDEIARHLQPAAASV